MNTPRIYPWPEALPRSTAVRLEVEGRPVDVLPFGDVAFAAWGADGPCRVTLEAPAPPELLAISPMRLGIEATAEDRGTRKRFTFTCPGPGKYRLAPVDGAALYLSVHATAPSAPEDADRSFPAGRIHDAGVIALDDHQTLRIEAGAVVRGRIRLKGRTGCRIEGPGLFLVDELEGPGHAGISLDDCRDCSLDGFTIVNTRRCWCCEIGGSEDVRLRNLDILSFEHAGDTIDIVGSRRVAVSGCLLHSGDDCIALKALDGSKPAPYIRALRRSRGLDDPPKGRTFTGDVTDIDIADCRLYAAKAGNAIEIGYETLCGEMRDIRIHDIDILGVHSNGPGAALGIHNGDHAHVHRVRFERIHVEHHYARLIDFQVLASRWNKRPGEGRISDILVRDLHLRPNHANPGYTVSLLGSCAPSRPVENIRIERVTRGGHPLDTPEKLELFQLNARDVRIR